ncbi:MAG: hypothetical protein SynsKO_43830 [Synoicihabitans sp.]
MLTKNRGDAGGYTTAVNNASHFGGDLSRSGSRIRNRQGFLKNWHGPTKENSNDECNVLKTKTPAEQSRG